jgi:hypothetical protein
MSRNWMDMAQDRDQWRALVNTVLHLITSISYRCENYDATFGFHKMLGVLEGLHTWRSSRRAQLRK